QKISARNKTAATVSYPDVPTWVTTGAYYDSADLTGIVQEIVDRTGWTAGNAMVVIAQGGTSTGRVIWAKEGYVNKPTKLTISYVAE
ncbi:MAG: hypothetical protein LLG06_19485, partial [Desulfobacteraceae bacterium]|nr:hypothetical protein [Desulfobacteraceae bacterium]